MGAPLNPAIAALLGLAGLILCGAGLLLPTLLASRRRAPGRILWPLLFLGCLLLAASLVASIGSAASPYERISATPGAESRTFTPTPSRTPIPYVTITPSKTPHPPRTSFPAVTLTLEVKPTATPDSNWFGEYLDGRTIDFSEWGTPEAGGCGSRTLTNSVYVFNVLGGCDLRMLSTNTDARAWLEVGVNASHYCTLDTSEDAGFGLMYAYSDETYYRLFLMRCSGTYSFIVNGEELASAQTGRDVGAGIQTLGVATHLDTTGLYLNGRQIASVPVTGAPLEVTGRYGIYALNDQSLHPAEVIFTEMRLYTP